MPKVVSSLQIKASQIVILSDGGYVLIIALKIHVCCWYGGLNPPNPVQSYAIVLTYVLYLPAYHHHWPTCFPTYLFKMYLVFVCN